MVLTAMTASLSAIIEFKTEGNLGNKQKKRKKFFLLAFFSSFWGLQLPFFDAHSPFFGFYRNLVFEQIVQLLNKKVQKKSARVASRCFLGLIFRSFSRKMPFSVFEWSALPKVGENERTTFVFYPNPNRIENPIFGIRFETVCGRFDANQRGFHSCF